MEHIYSKGGLGTLSKHGSCEHGAKSDFTAFKGTLKLLVAFMISFLSCVPSVKRDKPPFCPDNKLLP